MSLSWRTVGHGTYRAVGADHIYTVRREGPRLGWRLTIHTARKVSGIKVTADLAEGDTHDTLALTKKVAEAFEHTSDQPHYLNRYTRAILAAYAD